MRRFPTISVLVVLIASGCDRTECGNEIASRTASPNGHLEAVVFNRNCGATTGFNTQLSIIPSGQEPQDTGNVLILDGTVPLKLTWPSTNALTVAGVGHARVFHKSVQVTGVAISYAD